MKILKALKIILKPKRKQKEKFQKIIRLADNRPHPQDSDELGILKISKQIKECEGTVSIDLKGEPLIFGQNTTSPGIYVNKYPSNYRCESFFMVVFGVSKTICGKLNATPIVWSPLSGQMDEHAQFLQFKAFGDALKSVLGFNDIEAFYHTSVFHRMLDGKENLARITKAGRRTFKYMGSACNFFKRRYVIKKMYHSKTKEQLQEILAREDVAKITKRSQPPQNVFHESRLLTHKGAVDLTLKRMNPEDFEGLLLASFQKGSTPSYFFQTKVDSTEEERLEYGFKCIHKIFDIWLLWERDLDLKGVPRNDHILDFVIKMEVPVESYKVANEFLDNPENAKKYSSEERICEDCGKHFILSTSMNIVAFHHHRKQHFYDNYKCDCPEVLDFKALSAGDKKRHVQLKHMKSFTECQHCQRICKTSLYPGHFNSHHKPYYCEFCGTHLHGELEVQQHFKSVHPNEKAPKLTKRTSEVNALLNINSTREMIVPQRGNWCEICNKEQKNIHTHNYNEHKLFPCEICGEELKGSYNRHMHNALIHDSSSCAHIGKFPCEYCGKIFVILYSLKVRKSLLTYICIIIICNFLIFLLFRDTLNFIILKVHRLHFRVSIATKFSLAKPF